MVLFYFLITSHYPVSFLRSTDGMVELIGN